MNCFFDINNKTLVGKNNNFVIGFKKNILKLFHNFNGYNSHLSEKIITTMGSNTDILEKCPIRKGNSHTLYGNSLCTQFSPLLLFFPFGGFR